MRCGTVRCDRVVQVPGSSEEIVRERLLTYHPLYTPSNSSTGDAWADVLTGDMSPSGKLPVTFPLASNQGVQPCTGSADCVYSEKLLVGWRAFEEAGAEVAFPFGHGLSYGSFEYGGE